MFSKRIYLMCLYSLASVLRLPVVEGTFPPGRGDERDLSAKVKATDTANSPTPDLTDAEKFTNLADQFYREHKFDKAHQCYSKAIEANPNGAKYYRNRALFYDRMRMFEWAVEDYKKLLELEHRDMRSWFSLGRTLFEMGKYEEALEPLQKAVDHCDESNVQNVNVTRMRLMLQVIHLQAAETARQLKTQTFSEIRNGNESDPRADVEITNKSRRVTGTLDPVAAAEKFKTEGNVFYGEGRYEEALRCYNQAIKMNPNEAKHYRNRGFCYKRMNRMNLAIKDFQKSLEMQPNNIRGLYLMGRTLLEMGNFEEAIKHLKEAFDEGAKLNLISSELLLIASLLEMARRGMYEVDEAQQQDEMLSRSDVDLRTGGTDVEITNTLNLITGTTLDPVAAAEKFKTEGNVFYNEGRYEEALRCYNQAIKTNPNEAKHYRNRGTCYEKMKKMNLAVEDYEKSLEIEPHNVRGLFKKGGALLEMEKFEEAVKTLEKVLYEGAKQNAMRSDIVQIASKLKTARQKHRGVEKAKQRNETFSGEGDPYVDREVEAAVADSLTSNVVAAEELHSLGQDFLRENKFEDALLCYRKAIEMNPKEKKYYRSRELCASLQLLAVESDKVKALLSEGLALIEARKFEAAVKVLEKALEYGTASNNVTENEIAEIRSKLEMAREKLENAARQQESN